MQLNARQDPPNDSTVRSALIVDDDARLRRLLVDFLEQSNWQTYEAADGIDALEAARLHHPSIIILDLMMPRLDGMETCRRLRQVSQVPIIMLTARDDEVDKLLGLELGADDARQTFQHARARRPHRRPSCGALRHSHFPEARGPRRPSLRRSFSRHRPPYGGHRMEVRSP